jgi:hypothetical protein
MAFGTRTSAFNPLDSVIGALEYSPGGGNAPSINAADGYELQGVGCAEFRLDSATNFIQAFGNTGGTAVDLSSTGSCALFWFNTSVGATLTSFDSLIYDGTSEGPTNLGSFYPGSGGYVPVWTDIPSLSGTITTSNVEAIGFRVSSNDAGSGNKVNSFLDNVRTFTGTEEEPFFVNGTPTAATHIQDVRDSETTKSTGYNGLLVLNSGIDFFYAKLVVGEGATAGTAVATTFSESNRTIIFVDQAAITTTWLGWVVNLGNASTSFSLSNCTLQSSSVSAATNRPELVFENTTGTATITNSNLAGFRTIDLTSACSINGGIIDSQNLTQSSAEIENADIRPRTAANVALCDDPTFGAADIHDCTITQAGSGHAFEFTSGQYGASPIAAINFNNLIFSGFGADTTSSAALLNSTGATITINLNGTSNTPTYSGDPIVFVASKTLTITNIEAGTELRVYTYVDLGSPLSYTELVGAENIAGSPESSTFDTVTFNSGTQKYEATFSYDASGGDIDVVIVAHNINFEFFRITETLSSTENTTISLFQVEDRQYEAGSI